MTAASRSLITLCLTCLPLAAFAQTVQAPLPKTGDQWTYRVTQDRKPSTWKQANEVLTVDRVTSSGIYFTTQQKDAPGGPQETIAGLDWSRIRTVDGKQTAVARPLNFPLESGKTWNLNFTEHHPNPNFNWLALDVTYRVVGYETVQVPAGQFNAVKIEAEGQWSQEAVPRTRVLQSANLGLGDVAMGSRIQKTGAVATSGRLYRAYWYAPEVGRWVKSVEESYSTQGVRNLSSTEELESYTLAPR
jgi:hypothetical protein